MIGSSKNAFFAYPFIFPYKTCILVQKTMESMIDHLDTHIIELLKENARYSYADLGRKIGLSPSSVKERIQKMEDIGIIESYTLKTNPSLLGYEIEVFILLKIFDGKLSLMIQEISSFKEVKEAHRITGPYNIHIHALLKNQKHLQQFIDKLINYGSPTTLLILSEIPAN